MLHWLRHYKRAQLPGDIGAGIVVAMMMVPQGMAYALVAGLPPVYGIYASILPPLLYAVFGTSMTQSVGPMAIVSLMTATALAPLAAAGSGLYLVLAGQLAGMVGVVLLVCGMLRVGFLANFFSRPVMSGFTIGAALVIVSGQVKPLLGGDPAHADPTSMAVGLASMLALVLARSYLAPALAAAGLRKDWADMASKLAPMGVVMVASAVVAIMGLQVQTTGAVPPGLPQLNLASSPAHWRSLLQPALLIAFIVFLTSMSAAQTLALKRREKLRTNSELLGLGAANVASALSGAFPVTGSMSRSAVNFSAGANTPLASMITAVLLAIALVVPNGALALLPLPTLAATIIVAVLGMLELDTLRQAWRYDRGDAMTLLACTGGVLLLGVEAGVIIGVALSMGLLIWRESRPHIAVLGRIAGTEHFRNIVRFPHVQTLPDVLVLRIDAGLFFGNVEAVSARLADELQARPATRHLVLVFSAVNSIDTSALFGLLELNASLRQRGIGLHLAEVKGPVMDRLKESDLPARLNGKIFLSTVLACEELAQPATVG